MTDGTRTPLRWPAAAAPPEHLRFFCFPTSILERLRAARPTDGAPDGFGFTFSFTASDGSVRYACAVTGADGGGPPGALVAVSVVILCDWPMLRPMLDACKSFFLMRQARPLLAQTLASHARELAAGLARSDAEISYLLQHPLWLPLPLAPLLEMTHAAAAPVDALLTIFLASLLERPLLLVSSSAAKLLPAAAALAATLSPISYSGTFIPLLPGALHPDPATLINCSPTPFIIGLERSSLPHVEPLASHLLLFDLDEGSLVGAETLQELRGLSKAPIVSRFRAELAKHVPSSFPVAAASERALQATILSFMAELLDPSVQRPFAHSTDGADAACAAECRAAIELSEDILQYTAMDRHPPPTQAAFRQRVVHCRADALVRICERAPHTPTRTFMAAVYQSRSVREFVLAPPTASSTNRVLTQGAPAIANPRPTTAEDASPAAAITRQDTSTFADASWLAAGLDARQSVAEHAAALDMVQALVEGRLSEACPALLRSTMMSPRTANFQQRFEVGVNEELLGAFPCALHSGLGLRQGVLHVSTRHVCFEAALFASAYTKLPIERITSVEAKNDPLFHLIPNAIRLCLDDGSMLHFASFQHREEALALLAESVSNEGNSC